MRCLGLSTRLSIERQMPCVFGNQNVGNHRLGRQPTFDQPFRCWRLNHRLFTRPAGIFGPVRHDHPELRRHHVEPLRGFTPLRHEKTQEVIRLRRLCQSLARTRVNRRLLRDGLGGENGTQILDRSTSLPTYAATIGRDNTLVAARSTKVPSESIHVDICISVVSGKTALPLTR
jgi:hypothetical protein